MAMKNTPATTIGSGSGPLQSRTIDYLRFLMAFAVVLLHASAAGADSELPVYSSLSILLGQGLCRIAVPCFFFISGYLFFKGLEAWDWGVWTTKIKRRVHTLLIPYILWNILAAVLIYGYNWLRVRFGNGDPAALAEMTERWGPCAWRIFWDYDKGMPLDYPLWFIRTLIVYTLLTPLVFVLCKYLKGIGVLLVGVLVIGVFRAQQDLLFYVAGAWLSLGGKDLVVLFRHMKWPAVAVSVFILCWLPMTYRNHPDTYYYLLNLLKVTGIASLFGLVSAGLDAKGILHDRPFLSRSSFFLFASHGILILDDIARYFMLHLTSARNELYYCLDIFVRTAVTIAICLALYWAVERFLPGLNSVLNGARVRRANAA